MSVNIKLLNKVMAHILANPEEWDQNVWALEKPSCGTTCCIAGWAVQMQHPTGSFTSAVKMNDGNTYWEKFKPSSKARGEYIEELASYDLGLASGQAEALFAGSNKLPDLLRMVAALNEDPGASISAVRNYDF